MIITILKQPGVEVDCKDEDGETLLLVVVERATLMREVVAPGEPK